MKIVQLSMYDYGGSGYKYKQAIERLNPNIEYTCVVSGISRARMMFNFATGVMLTKENKEKVSHLIKEADVIHYKGDDLPTGTWGGITIPKKTPKIITVSGSGFRRGKSRVAFAWHPIEDYVKATDIRTAMTPDLNYPEFKGMYVPQAIDSLSQATTLTLTRCPYCKTRIPFTVTHSPSTGAKKGTDRFILPALDRLKRTGTEFVLDMIENTPHQECVERKKKASIFIDQVCETGAFGNSGLEAMQFGIPTIAGISQQSIDQSDGLWDDLPVLNCSSKKDIYKTIKMYANEPELLREISTATKQYVDKYHSYEAVGKMWEKILQKL